MRGARRQLLLELPREGIIPADAGSTSLKRTIAASGDNGEDMSAFSTGSSPRMRGAHTDHSLSVWLNRIIPADAGSTYAVRVPVGSAGDHPRGCGEHITLDLFKETIQGSSPRMRGARLLPSVFE